MKHTTSFKFFVMLCVTLLAGAVAFAQSDTAQISGYVKDASDAVIPGA